MEQKNIKFSNHAVEQINNRGLAFSEVEDVLINPDQILHEVEDISVYQKIVYKINKPYLYRVFVNTKKNPNLVITAYKTSKINKYENKI